MTYGYVRVNSGKQTAGIGAFARAMVRLVSRAARAKR
jgi:hypothetical protein